MIRPLLLLSLIGVVLLALGGDARAQSCTVVGPFCELRPNAAQGQDVSPYSFLPNLSRGQYETNYSFVTTDDDGLSHAFETYLRFDLPANLLDPGETVTSATLLLYYAFTFGFDGPAPTLPHAPITVRAHEVTGFWTEDNLIWGNKPPYVAAPAATLGGITNLGLKEFDVTALVRAWAHGTKPNYGFAITSPQDIPFGMNSWEADAIVPATQKARLAIIVGPGTPPASIPLFPYGGEAR